MAEITLDEYLKEIEELRAKRAPYPMSDKLYQCMHVARTGSPKVAWATLASWCAKMGLSSLSISALRMRYIAERDRRGDIDEQS